MPGALSTETVSAQLQLRTPNKLGSALAGAATPTAVTRVTAAQTRILVGKCNSPASGCPNRRCGQSRTRSSHMSVALRLRGKARAVRAYARADEVPGMVAVEATVLHHVTHHIARLLAGAKFAADLTSGVQRGLR
jgi:hypothetical protein